MMSAKAKQSPKKGVGKLKEYGKGNSSKIKGSDLLDSSGKECVLSFPLLKTVDNDRMLPRYSAILNRTEDDGVGMEDLDALQLELEALLSAVVVRTRVLQVKKCCFIYVLCFIILCF
jgi:transcriptional adapter 3